MNKPITPPIAELTRRIDQAVLTGDCSDCCQQVKAALTETIREHGDCLDESWLEPVEGSYGRRLLHRDPQGRYTIVVMIWAAGQGTPIHDHSGMWCVEGVYQGKIRVVSYQLLDKPEGDQFRFQREEETFAGVGEAGALIPPYEYHTIENPFDSEAATIHVYGGEMEQCQVFLPAGETNHYERLSKPLSYTP